MYYQLGRFGEQKIPCLFLELNHGSSVVQPKAYILYPVLYTLNVIILCKFVLFSVCMCCIYICVCVVYTCVYVLYIHLCVRKPTGFQAVCEYKHICKYACMDAYMYVYMCVCIYNLHTNILFVFYAYACMFFCEMCIFLSVTIKSSLSTP